MADTYKLFDSASTTSLKPPHNRFNSVPLPGKDYMPGSKLFPKRVLVGFHADLNEYTSATWSKYLQEKANGYTHATTVFSCSASNSGNVGGQYWFGYVFGGQPASAEDFVKAPEQSKVSDALAFSGNVPQ